MENKMSDWTKEILNRLEKYSGHEVEYDSASVSVTCTNDDHFAVSIHQFGDEFQVNFDGWHEHFEELSTALDCFAFGLSDQCRLKVTLRGAMECAWTVQSRAGSNWKDDTTTGLLVFPFWRTKHFEFRQNALSLKE